MPIDATELDRLIYALLDETITLQEHVMLEGYLLENPHALDRYQELVELHNLLEIEAELSQATKISSLGHSNIIPMDRQLKSQRRKQLIRTAITAAALILTSLVILNLSAVESSATAVITSSPHTQFTIKHDTNLKNQPAPNSMEAGSTLLLRQGIIELTFSSGVNTIIQAPAKVTLIDESHVEIHYGRAWFDNEVKVENFRATTPKLKALDLGTVFGIIADKTENHELHVFEGKVEATTTHGNLEKTTLKESTAVITTPSGGLSTIPFNRDLFYTKLPETIPYLHWNFDQESLSDIATTGNQLLASQITTMPMRTANQIDGKYGKAFSFTTRSGPLVTSWQGVAADAPRTISCWIKYSARNPSGAIVEWGIPESNSAKWRITLNPEVQNEGGVRGAIRTEFGNGYVIGSTDLRDDQWHHIVSVYDGSGKGSPRSIKHYIDGKLEPVSAYQANVINTTLNKSKSQPCLIGNRFKGAIDDLRIYQGVLPANAIPGIMHPSSN